VSVTSHKTGLFWHTYNGQKQPTPLQPQQILTTDVLHIVIFLLYQCIAINRSDQTHAPNHDSGMIQYRAM